MVKPSSLVRSILDNYLSERVDNKNRKVHCFHPSSLASCPRKLYDLYLADDLSSSDTDPRVKRVFDNGHSAHARIQNYCREAGILVDENVPVFDSKFEICGEADAILSIFDVLVVLDIKTINRSGFTRLTVPSLDYLIQLNVYMYCLGLDHGILLYECKDDQSFAEFWVPYDQEILIPVFQKINYVRECIKSGTVPAKDPSYDCKRCDLAESCK